MFAQINKILSLNIVASTYEFIYQIIRLNWYYAKCISNGRFKDNLRLVHYVNARALMIHLRQSANEVHIFNMFMAVSLAKFGSKSTEKWNYTP